MMPGLGQPVVAMLLLCAQLALAGTCVVQRTGFWRAVPEPMRNGWLFAFFAFAGGMAADSALLFALGLAGGLRPAIALPALGVATLAAILALDRSALRGFAARGVLPGWALGAALLTGVALLAIRPPGHWDDTMYHLPLARAYLADGGFSLQPYLRFPLFPQDAELMMALGLMSGATREAGTVVAQFLANLPVAVTAFGVIGLLKSETGATWPGAVASALVFGFRPLVETLGFAYVDATVMMYAYAATLAVLIGLRASRSGASSTAPAAMPFAAAGALAGMAAGTKYLGLIAGALPLLWVALALRRARPVLACAAGALAFGAWWYLRSWWLSGNPVHPAAPGLFGYFLWNADDVAGQVAEQATHGVARSVLALGPALAKADAWPLALVALAAIFWRRLDDAMRLNLFVFAGYLMFWLHVTQVSRYLVPALGPAVTVIGWSLWQLAGVDAPAPRGASRARRAVAAAVCASLALALLWASGRSAREQARDWESRLASRAGVALIAQANRLIPELGPRAVAAGFENAVWFHDGTMIGDWFGPGRYSQMIRCTDRCRLASAAQMAEVMRRHGARVLLVNTDRFPFDEQDYAARFELRGRNAGGALLTLR